MIKYFAIIVSVQYCTLHVRYTVGSVIKTNISHDNNSAYYCQWCGCHDLRKMHVVNCSYLGLLKLPNSLDNKTTVFDISHNRVAKLKNNSFSGSRNLKELILTRNRIDWIDTGFFDSLVSLEILDLSFNKLLVLQTVLKPGMFSKMQNLRHLKLQGNVKHPRYALQGIPEYPIVEATSLESLIIDGVTNASFGKEYSKLTKLMSITMSGSNGFCRIGYLSRVSFWNLPELKYLKIDECDIIHIDDDTFYYTKSLISLDLSWNYELEFNAVGKAAYGLKYTSLGELKINAIHNPYRAGTEILRENMRHIRDLKLEKLYMDHNGIEYIDYGVSSMLPTSLRLLTLRQNRLNFGLYLVELIFNNPNLIILNAGEQEVAIRSDRVPYAKYLRARRKRYVDKILEIMRGTTNITTEQTSPSQIKTAQFKHDIGSQTAKYADDATKTISKTDTQFRLKRSIFQTPIHYTDSSDDVVSLSLERMICSGSRSDFHFLNFTGIANNITEMDISENFIPVVRTNVFIGLDKLQLLNLSNNYVEHLQRNAFAGLENLKKLDLTHNLLGFEIKSDSHASILSHFQTLTYLNLSYNRITSIPHRTFASLNNLLQLNLSYNYIEMFEISLTNLKSLESIDLSGNKIQVLSATMRNSLDALAVNHSFKINLSGNKLLCNCETLQFLYWLVYTKVHIENMESYHCSLSNGSVRSLNETNEMFDNLHEECKSYLHLAIGSSAGTTFIFTFILVSVIYKNRWKLRYMYYMAKVRLDLEGKTTNSKQESGYQFDAFIAYADGDRHFVAHDMIEKLEKAAGLKLVIRDRDYEIGESIALNISKSIRCSRKTLLLLSRRFLMNKWCDFELHFAQMESIHTKRDVIVLIFLESMSSEKLSLPVMDLLRSCPSIEWPKYMYAQKMFWDKCVTFINK